MNTHLLIAAVCAAALAPAARADKFHLATKEQEQKMTAGQADVIEGVLLEQKDNRYVIRIQGGQIELPTSRVHEIEKDGLTVAQIEQREAKDQDRLAQAESQRQQMAAAWQEASAQRLREAHAAEAAATVNEARPPAEAAAAAVTIYDPVLHIAREATAGAYDADYYIRKELGGIIRRNLDDAVRLAGAR